MKKRILALIGLGLAALTAAAQDHMYRPDTAAMLVDRYLGIMNADAMPRDSMLTLETKIYTVGTTDTFTLKRWYAWPQEHRIEVWRPDGSMQTAFSSNGNGRIRMYKPDLGYWVDITADAFYDRLSGYDWRGPLYGWRVQNARLEYRGRVVAKDHGEMASVLVQVPERYDREYMFEPTGLLAFIRETGNMDTSNYKPFEAARIEMKFMHEYQAVGPMVLPRVESFVRRGRVTVQTTEAAIVGRDEMIFNADNPTR